MAVAALTEKPPQETLEQTEQMPLVINVAEMDFDHLIRTKTERFIGQVLTRREAERPFDKPRIDSLKQGIHMAAQGDLEADAMVEANIAFDVIERTQKAGTITKTKQKIDDFNKTSQHGQSGESVQANAILYASNHPAMRRRVEPEARNAFRIQMCLELGLLEDYVFYVRSRAADNMSLEDMDQAGFFIDTMSTASQATTLENGELVTESAFEAGIASRGQPRHDKQTTATLGRRLGVNWDNKDDAETIDEPALIHKSLIPNGIVDIVKMADDGAGGLFFGQAVPRQDYASFPAKCQEHEKTYRAKILAIKADLIAEANSIKTEVQATNRLNKLSGKHMVDKAIDDHSIDPRVFGSEAAAYVIEARMHQQLGNYELAEFARKRAQKTENSGSCPSGGSKIDDTEADIYGFSPEGSKSWHGGKIHKNIKCNSCKKVKAEVGACHICKDCVDNPKQMERAHRQAKLDELRKGRSKGGYLFSLSLGEVQPMLNSKDSGKKKTVKKPDGIGAIKSMKPEAIVHAR